MRERQLQISPSSLNLYLDCPRRYYYSRTPEVPKLTDYARLCGSEVHRHISQLYKLAKDGRPFYFKDKKAALGAWINRWKRAVEGATSNARLMLPDEEKTKQFLGIGMECISNYWDTNFGKPRPLEIEQRYSTRLPNGVRLVGVFDQIRQPPLEWVAKHRPEVMENGRLREEFAQVVIMDFKTDFLSYDAKAIRENPSLEEEIRRQYELHESLQATAYTFLYEQVWGKKPVGFVWCHLRSRKTFFTFREERDYQTFMDVIDHVVGNLDAQSFPKHIGRHCERCEFLKPCREDRLFYISAPEDFPEAEEVVQPLSIATDVTKSNVRQRRLKLRVERVKKQLPEVSRVQTPIVLQNLPWDDKNDKENGEIRCGDCATPLYWSEADERFICPSCGMD